MPSPRKLLSPKLPPLPPPESINNRAKVAGVRTCGSWNGYLCQEPIQCLEVPEPYEGVFLSKIWCK